MTEPEDPLVRDALDAFWAEEPLCFEWVGHGKRETRFEFSSRGDRVEGQLHARSGEAGPLIVLIPGAREGAAAPFAVDCAEQWSAKGAAVARLDLPLHGSRESVKLSDALREATADPSRLAGDPDARRLAEEFLRQTAWDLRGVLAGLSTVSEVDATRVACVSTGLAAWACALALSVPSLRAPGAAAPGGPIGAALLVDLPTGGPSGLDAEAAVAAGFTGRVQRVEGHEELAGRVWPFLAESLGL